MSDVINITVYPAPVINITKAEPDSFLGGPPKALPADMQNKNTTEDTAYVTPYLAWLGINQFRIEANTFPEKQALSKGINVGNNTVPSNGDFWFDGSNFWIRIAGVSYRIITGASTNHGRILYVSKNGNNSTAIIGNPNFPYADIQTALNAGTHGDMFKILKGTWNENLNFSSYNSITFALEDAIIVGNHTTVSTTNTMQIAMVGVSEFRGANTGSSPIIYFVGGNLRIVGGAFTTNNTGVGLYLQSVNATIENVRFANTSTGLPVFCLQGNTGATTMFRNCDIRSTTSAACVELHPQSINVIFDTCRMVNTGTGVAFNGNGQAMARKCMFRSAASTAVTSLSGNLQGNFDDCIAVSNTATAVYGNNGCNFSFNGGYIYAGTNCIERGAGNGVNGNFIEINYTRLYAVGQILNGIPNTSLGKTQLNFCIKNKALSSTVGNNQLADMRVTDNNPTPNTTMFLPPTYLTFVC